MLIGFQISENPSPLPMVTSLWRAPPIDIIPVYDEQQGPSIDDYTCPPLEDHRSGLSNGFLLLNNKSKQAKVEAAIYAQINPNYTHLPMNSN